MEDNQMYYMLPMLTSFSLLLEDQWSWRKSMPYLIGLLIPCMPFLTKILKGVQTWCARILPWLLPRRGKLEFVARQQIRRWHDDPDSIIRNFSTVMWDWNSRNEVVGIVNVVEEANAPINRFFNDDDDEGEDGTLKGSPLFVDDIGNQFYNVKNSNIKYTMWIERAVDRDGTNLSEILLKIEFSGTLEPKDMVSHIEWLKSEAIRIRDSRKRKQRILVSTDSEEISLQFMTYEFHTTSSFANFFSEEATSVYKDIQHFLTRKEDYLRLGKPWTYTVLNTGPPGVGKTKLVKALAAHTGYTVIIINLQHINDMKSLYNAFHSSVLAGEKIPHDRRLYYIPEVDTQVFDMLESRSTSQSYVLAGAAKKEETKKGVGKRPTLGEILNVLDGVPERYGHIIVLDTNCLERLDAALVRPGRVDRILQWEKMSDEQTRKYLTNYFEERVPENAKLPHRVYTAAELGSILRSSVNIHNAIKVLQAKQKLKPKLRV